MNITIISIAKFENQHFKEIFLKYQKRISNLEIKEIEFKKSKSLPVPRIKEDESRLILKNIDKGAKIIALDERGKLKDSKSFAKSIENYSNNGVSRLNFIIGGAFGLSQEILDTADEIISLSKMTYTHMMARIILVEQIYRANTINSNHPYHKE